MLNQLNLGATVGGIDAENVLYIVLADFSLATPAFALLVRAHTHHGCNFRSVTVFCAIKLGLKAEMVLVRKHVILRLFDPILLHLFFLFQLLSNQEVLEVDLGYLRFFALTRLLLVRQLLLLLFIIIESLVVSLFQQLKVLILVAEDQVWDMLFFPDWVEHLSLRFDFLMTVRLLIGWIILRNLLSFLW